MNRDPIEALSETVKSNLHWAAVLSRLSMASLFLSAAIFKVPGGVSGTVGYYQGLLQKSLLPSFLITAHASAIMFVEFGLGLWLLSGYRLALAWRAAALVLVSLAVGMIFAAKFDVASDNYVYVFLAIIGLLLSHFDRWTLGVKREAREPVAERSSGARAAA